MKVSIKTAAKELGIAIGTLRRWEVEGKIKAERILEIITGFSARLYGSRSRKNKQVVEHLRGVIDENSHKNTTSVR
jgi:predicted site-specific integrase-resolvase